MYKRWRDVRAPGPWESLIPIWGPARTALNHYQQGKYFWTFVNASCMLSDLFLLSSLIKGVTRGAFKGGSHAWHVTRHWYGKTRGLERGTHVHHWLIQRGGFWGKHLPDWIKNQPWNLMPMPQARHIRVHGWGGLRRFWYGTPHWAKATLGLLGRSCRRPTYQPFSLQTGRRKSICDDTCCGKERRNPDGP